MGWTPYALGPSLLAWWDASRSDLITAPGGAVSSWRDVVAAYDCVQASGGAQPILSATSLNGRPGVTFDGVDDFLRMTGVGALPTGAAACEMWVLASQAALAADVTGRRALSYGGNATNTSRCASRASVTLVNRGRTIVGTGAANTTIDNLSVDYSGIHVLRCMVGATTGQTDVDGTAGTPAGAIPATGTTNITLGGSTIGVATAFWSGPVAHVLVTPALTTAQASSLLAYLKSYGGVP